MRKLLALALLLPALLFAAPAQAAIAYVNYTDGYNAASLSSTASGSASASAGNALLVAVMYGGPSVTVAVTDTAFGHMHAGWRSIIFTR